VKELKHMTEPELREYTHGLALWLENCLPPGPSAKGKCLFALLFTDDAGPGIGQYVSNVERAGMIKMLRETANRLERRQDVPR
jgi:hypothetical protein